MSQTDYHGWHLRLKIPRYINTMKLHSLVPKVGDYNMGRVKRVKRIEKAKGVEKAIGEIR